MPDRRSTLMAAAAVPITGCQTPPIVDRAALASDLRAAETSFAATMARRDLAAFEASIDPDAVFVNGGDPLRGRPAIVAFWRRFFEGPAAPFSWAPDLVELSGDGHLGYTTGPVRRPDGTVFLRFASTWRRTEGGRWLIVFDNGHEVCPPSAVNR